MVRYISKKYIFKYNGSKESFLTILDSFHTNNSSYIFCDLKNSIDYKENTQATQS